MEKAKKKQIPFRYDESYEEDFKEVMTLQSYGEKKNLAIKHALIITAALIRKKKKLKKNKGSGSHEICIAITDDLKIKRLPWQ